MPEMTDEEAQQIVDLIIRTQQEALRCVDVEWRVKQIREDSQAVQELQHRNFCIYTCTCGREQRLAV